MSDHIILIAHGSKDSRWLEPFKKLEEELIKEVGKDKLSLCYLDFAKPNLESIVEKAYKKKIKSFKIIPLFMAGGGHVAVDIPEQAKKILEKYPDVTLKMTPAIGEDPLIYGAIKEVIKTQVMF